MGWIHDTGYGPAYDHEGYAANVLDDGTDIGTSSDAIDPHVVGWRAACECGWRGDTFYSRVDHPNDYGFAPREVSGYEDDGGCYVEWNAHLAAAVPALAVHDATHQFDRLRATLDAAVATARAAGESWSTIGEAAGMSRQSAHERWQHVAVDSCSHTSVQRRVSGDLLCLLCRKVVGHANDARMVVTAVAEPAGDRTDLS